MGPVFAGFWTLIGLSFAINFYLAAAFSDERSPGARRLVPRWAIGRLGRLVFPDYLAGQALSLRAHQLARSLAVHLLTGASWP
jgi:hypothetical protein